MAHEFTPDCDREERCGFPEVIYGAGKTPEQIVRIAYHILEASDCMLATRLDEERGTALLNAIDDAVFLPRSGIAFVDRRKDERAISAAARRIRDAGDPDSFCADRITSPTESDRIAAILQGGEGNTVVCCAGTSDLPVAEEAALTARLMGSAVTLVCDVGIAGVHRILEREKLLRSARAIAVVAGMEGALPSVVAGLVDVPVIAVPTSVGYGASFGGIAALLGMLNSCAGGVSVVNIDNGFGAGQILDRINRPPARFRA